MQAAVDFLNGWIWSKGLIFLCLGVGLFFSIRTRFAQVRHFGEMIRLMLSRRAAPCNATTRRDSFSATLHDLKFFALPSLL